MKKSTKLNKEITINTLLGEINEAEKQCYEMLNRLHKQRTELTGEEIVSFSVSTIHKDRKSEIFEQLLLIDNKTTLKKLEEQWKKSSLTNESRRFGTVFVFGVKKKATPTKLNKIAKHGGTIITNPIHKIKTPPPNKWWERN